MAINKTVNKRTKSYGALKNVIAYLLKDLKVKDGYVDFVGPLDEDYIDAESVFNAFCVEKEIWNKEDGRLYVHNIISFHKDENITHEQALDFGKKYAETWYPSFQSLIAVHQDKEHVHIHFVTNTVSFEDGKKIHTSKRDLEKMKQWTNDECLQRGLTVSEKGKHFDGTEMDEGEITTWSKNKYNLVANSKKESYVASCALAVLEASENAVDKDAFVEAMKAQGWEVNWNDKRKHITFVDEEGHKVRDNNITKTFKLDISKETLNAKFERTKERRAARANFGRTEADYRRIIEQESDNSRTIEHKKRRM